MLLKSGLLLPGVELAGRWKILTVLWFAVLTLILHDLKSDSPTGMPRIDRNRLITVEGPVFARYPPAFAISPVGEILRFSG